MLFAFKRNLVGEVTIDERGVAESIEIIFEFPPTAGVLPHLYRGQ